MMRMVNKIGMGLLFIMQFCPAKNKSACLSFEKNHSYTLA